MPCPIFLHKDEGEKMKKYFFYALILALVPFATTASADTLKIGFVNAQKVLEGSAEGKQVQEKIKAFIESRQRIISLEEDELRQLDEELAQQAELLSPEAKKVKQEELQKKVMAYRKKAAEFDKEILEKRREIDKSFLDKIKSVIKGIAKKGGYTFVLNKSEGPGAVFYAQESLDLTEQVIAAIDKKK